MKYLFGPVPSRRLGRSLGIDPIPLKTCNYQCIYCQLGKTTNFTNERRNFYPKSEISTEIKNVLEKVENNIDYITFVGSGEPTLYRDLEDLILEVKRISNKPICVITNGALLGDSNVRNALMHTDAILPSLDAGKEKTFIKINRPHSSLNFKEIIKGLTSFRKQYKGKFWIEIMLMKNINDSEEELLKIKEKINLIKPDRIDINVPIRPPAEKYVEIPDKSIIKLLDGIFNDYNIINFPEMGLFNYFSTNFEKELLSIIERHPMRQKQIIETFLSKSLTAKEIALKLKELEQNKKIKKEIYENKVFWKLNVKK
ncbi:MAG: radical SAM protein [Promethearchaeota archaeon]